MEENTTYSTDWLLQKEIFHPPVFLAYTLLTGVVVVVLMRWIQQHGTGTEPSALNGVKLEPIPGPKPLPILGNVLLLDINDLVGSILAIAYQYRPIFQLTIGGKRDTFVSSPSLVREICDETRFHKLVTKGLERLRPVTGDGLFTAYHDNHAWGVAHRIIVPHFGTLRIRDMFDDMRDIAEQLCLKWARLESWAKLDLPSDFTRLTLDTVALTLLDYRFNSFYIDTGLPHFVQNIDFILAEAATTATLPDWAVSLRFPQRRKWHKCVAQVNQACQNMINARRAAGEKASRNDVLGAMVFATDPKTGDRLSDEHIIHNMLTFLSAGHETTSAMLALVCYFLCEYPDKLAAARAEVDAVVGEDSLTMQHLQKLPYLEAVLRETLRLAPTAPAFFVVPKKDEIIGGKYLVKKGATLCVALETLQRDPDVFGEDADQFRPERMLQEEFDAIDEFAWKPFGNGLRVCIGKTFVWQESLIIIALILQNFDIRKDDPSYKLKLRSDLSVKLDGFYMQARLREGLTAARLRHRLMQASNSKRSGAASVKQDKSFDEGFTGQPMTILHGSNTGTCEALALRLAANATSKGFAPHVVDTVNSAVGRLSTEGPVIIILASYNGLPADDTVEMVKWLRSLPSLSDVKYAVFGCGHRDWKETYQKVPRLVDELMTSAGALRLAPMGNADASTSDLFSDLEIWCLESLFPSLYKIYNVTPPSHGDFKTGVSVHTYPPMQVSARRDFHPFVVTASYRLSRGDVPAKRHIELRLPMGVDYAPGDHLLLYPRNDPDLVDRVLARFELCGDTRLRLDEAQAIGLENGVELTASEFFATCVELKQHLTSRHIHALAELAEEQDIKDGLFQYFETHERTTSLLQFLECFPQLPVPLSMFIRMLPSMRPRTYSISSAAAFHPGHCTLTLSMVPNGVASRFLDVQPSSGQVLYARIKPNRGFFEFRRRDVPIIMVCVGSGIAPFRGFVQECMLSRSKDVVPAHHIFYGCRGAELDDMYADELDAAQEAGILKVHRAYSRDADPEKRMYVTDLLKSEFDLVVGLWKAGASIRVCAGKEAADAIWAVLGPGLRTGGDCVTMDSDEMAEWRQKLGLNGSSEWAGRYLEEVFN